MKTPFCSWEILDYHPTPATSLESKAKASSPREATRCTATAETTAAGWECRRVQCRMVAVQSYGKAVCRLRPIEGVTIRELTGTAGACHLIASARPFAHGRAKRHLSTAILRTPLRGF
jgi:hypothetical protein